MSVVSPGRFKLQACGLVAQFGSLPTELDNETLSSLPGIHTKQVLLPFSEAPSLPGAQALSPSVVERQDSSGGKAMLLPGAIGLAEVLRSSDGAWRRRQVAGPWGGWARAPGYTTGSALARC